jgi:hypothetical protein
MPLRVPPALMLTDVLLKNVKPDAELPAPIVAHELLQLVVVAR